MGVLGRFTMNLPMLSTVAGDLITMWRRIAAVTIETIVQPVTVATNLRELTEPHLLPARCRLFHRNRVLVAHILVAHILVAHDHVECGPVETTLRQRIESVTVS
jgi:hypothetical protein